MWSLITFIDWYALSSKLLVHIFLSQLLVVLGRMVNTFPVFSSLAKMVVFNDRFLKSQWVRFTVRNISTLSWMFSDGRAEAYRFISSYQPHNKEPSWSKAICWFGGTLKPAADLMWRILGNTWTSTLVSLCNSPSVCLSPLVLQTQYMYSTVGARLELRTDFLPTPHIYIYEKIYTYIYI